MWKPRSCALRTASSASSTVSATTALCPKARAYSWPSTALTTNGGWTPESRPAGPPPPRTGPQGGVDPRVPHRGVAVREHGAGGEDPGGRGDVGQDVFPAEPSDRLRVGREREVGDRGDLVPVP